VHLRRSCIRCFRIVLPELLRAYHRFAEKTVGAVTAIALSHDHTYVAAGHATGHIQLFDLSKPQVPARSVAPTTLAAVASGRKEGHLQGSRIVNVGFVAGRHTAIFSADHTGLAFLRRRTSCEYWGSIRMKSPSCRDNRPFIDDAHGARIRSSLWRRCHWARCRTLRTHTT
jgi:hypothetical protein